MGGCNHFESRSVFFKLFSCRIVNCSTQSIFYKYTNNHNKSCIFTITKETLKLNTKKKLIFWHLGICKREIKYDTNFL